MPNTAQTPPASVARMAMWSILVAVAVLALKLVAWRLTGSVALYSDALESIVNVVSALVAWWALRYAQRPADDNHPLGHYKMEYLSAVLAGVMIGIAALTIISEAAQALLHPRELTSPTAGILVSLLATAGNLFWSRRLIALAAQVKSPALEADGRHLMTDVVTSAGVVLGIVLVAVTGWLPLDPLLAILVALNILWEGWKVIRMSLAGLLDEAVEPSEQEQIAQVIQASAHGAQEMHDLVTRRAGPVTFIEFHLIVAGDMTVNASHAICDRVEKALRQAVPGARVVIHVEPDYKSKPEGLSIEG